MPTLTRSFLDSSSLMRPRSWGHTSQQPLGPQLSKDLIIPANNPFGACLPQFSMLANLANLADHISLGYRHRERMEKFLCWRYCTAHQLEIRPGATFSIAFGFYSGWIREQLEYLLVSVIVSALSYNKIQAHISLVNASSNLRFENINDEISILVYHYWFRPYFPVAKGKFNHGTKEEA